MKGAAEDFASLFTVQDAAAWEESSGVKKSAAAENLAMPLSRK